MNKLKLALQILPPSAATRAVNAALVRFSVQGHHREVILIFSSALNSGSFTPDAFSFPSLVKAATVLGLNSLGRSIHQKVLLSGFSSDPYVSCSLLNFYAKFNNIKFARKVFDAMPQRDIVMYTAIIGCYSRACYMSAAFSLYNAMRYEGLQPSSVVILSMLSGVVDTKHASVLHACITKGGHSELFLTNCLLSVYAKCGSLEDAKEVFRSMDCKDLVTWNSLIKPYSMLGNLREVSELFLRMQGEGIEPDMLTFASVFSAVAGDGNVVVGRALHAKMVTSGFKLNKFVETSLMVMYLQCKKLDEALLVFKRRDDKDVILWNSMISGLLQSGSADRSLRVFREMLASSVRPSTVTLACVLASCAELGYVRIGASIHSYVLTRKMAEDITVQNSLVSMYGKCGSLNQSFAVFSKMQERNVVSWNAIVVCYAQNGYLSEALHLFHEMRIACQVPDDITVVSLLQACASVGAYQQGKWIHNHVVRNFVGPCIRIGTALVDMYFKCGDLVSARRIFDGMPQQDLVSWTTIIAGYGNNGKGKTALDMFSKFLKSGQVPNSVIFLAVLNACSHNGLVDNGMILFESMKKDFKIEPEIEHCACVVDLLCRAGRVQDAYKFYKKTFAKPFTDVLGIILDACRNNGHYELGETVADELYKLEPEDADKYVQLAHSCASVAKWEGVGDAWAQMRFLGLKKLPGWSFVELKGTITPFFMHHNSHPQYADIVAILSTLTNTTAKLVYSEEHEEFTLAVV